MSSPGYHINRKLKKSFAKRTRQIERAFLIGQLQQAIGILRRPILGRLRWAVLQK